VKAEAADLRKERGQVGVEQAARVDHAAGQQRDAEIEYAAHCPQAAELVDVQADSHHVQPAQPQRAADERQQKHHRAEKTGDAGAPDTASALIAFAADASNHGE
jgi:hypothetical protein